MTEGPAELAARKKPAPAPSPAQSEGLLYSWTVMSITAAVLTALGLAAIYGRYASAFRLTNDDWALVWNSALPYVTPAGTLKWFTEGYSNYFVNYPDWPAAGFPFVRPMANVAYLVQSLFHSSFGDAAYLLAAYVAIIVSAWLTMLAARRYTNMQPPLALALSLAVALSPVWYQGATISNMLTNSLATAFSLAALVALDARKGTPTGRRLVLTIAMLVLAVWSHETAAVMPLVCVALLYGMAPTAPRPKELLPFLAPLGLVVIHQLVLSGGSEYYVFAREDVGAGDRVRDFLPGMLIPFNDQIYSFAPRPLEARLAIPFYVGVVTNVAAIGVLVYGLIARPMRRRIALVAAVVLAAVPSVVMFGLPRFGGFVLAVSLIVITYLTAKAPRLRAGLIGLVLVSHLLHLAPWTPYIDTIAQTMPQAGSFYEQLDAAIDQEKPDAIVLVNDNVGDLGALSMLRIAAYPRADIDLTVINGLGGASEPGAAIEVAEQDGVLAIANQLAGRQWIMAHGAQVTPEKPNNGFTYEPLVGAPNSASFVARRPLTPGKTLVVGNDPATGTFLKWVFTK